MCGFYGVSGVIEKAVTHELDGTAIAQGGNLRVKRELIEHLEVVLCRDLVDVAFAENGQLFAAVRTYEVAVVLYDTEHRNAHHLCHLVGFHDDHAHQILRGRYDHYAVYRKRLENGQWNITGSWRHIDEEIVQVAPDDVGPELFYGSCCLLYTSDAADE